MDRTFIWVIKRKQTKQVPVTRLEKYIEDGWRELGDEKLPFKRK